jgi:Domain of unknown function (DUF4352)
LKNIFEKFKRPKKEPISKDTLLVLSIIALLTFVAVLAGNISDARQARTRAHEVREVVRVDGTYEMVVDKITLDNDLAKRFRLPDDKKILVVHARITNLSNENMDYIPSFHTFLRSSQGDSYDLILDVSQPTLPSKTVSPGETIEGNVAFMIEARTVPLWIYFDTHFKGEGPVVYSLVK